jgi:hypothetical protein
MAYEGVFNHEDIKIQVVSPPVCSHHTANSAQSTEKDGVIFFLSEPFFQIGLFKSAGIVFNDLRIVRLDLHSLWELEGLIAWWGAFFWVCVINTYDWKTVLTEKLDTCRSLYPLLTYKGGRRSGCR